MTHSKAKQPARPPASGKKLAAAIDESLKSLDALANSRLRPRNKWRYGPLVWKVMLEMSREGAADGMAAPPIRKHDLAFQLKRSCGDSIKVDHVLWKRYLSFHQQYRSRLHEGLSKLGLPALAVERLTNNGLGGDPDKTEAVFWLCFDSDLRAEAAASNLAAEAAEDVEAASSIEETTCAAKGKTGTSEPVNQPSANRMVDRSEPLPAPPDDGPASADVVTGKKVAEEHQTTAGESYLLWLATLSSRTERSSAAPAALALALALLAPALASAAAEIISPVQALADSISSLAEVFNGLIQVRT